MDRGYTEQYENLEKYHWWWLARRTLVIDNVKRVADHSRRQRLLDVGCGAGLQLAALKNDFDVTGVEPDPMLSDLARKNAAVPVLQHSLPLPSIDIEPFDLLLLLDVLEHLEDDAGGLQSVVSLLRPGGYLFINVPAHPWLWSVHDEVNQHKRRYTKRALLQLFQSCSLYVQSLYFWGTAFVPLALGRKLIPVQNGNYHVTVPRKPLSSILRRVAVLDARINSIVPFPFGLSLFGIFRRY